MKGTEQKLKKVFKAPVPTATDSTLNTMVNFKKYSVFLILFFLFFLVYASPLNKKCYIILTTVTGGKVPLNVELADTPAERARGLMFRQSLGESEGMLFVFEKPETPSFWMKNTKIPLSIAFFDEDKKLINIVI